jgi:hypothetical protein
MSAVAARMFAAAGNFERGAASCANSLRGACEFAFDGRSGLRIGAAWGT